MQINLHGARLNRIFVRTPSSSGRTGPPRIGPETGERRSKTDVFPEPSAEANKIRAMPRRKNGRRQPNLKLSKKRNPTNEPPHESLIRGSGSPAGSLLDPLVRTTTQPFR